MNEIKLGTKKQSKLSVAKNECDIGLLEMLHHVSTNITKCVRDRRFISFRNVLLSA